MAEREELSRGAQARPRVEAASGVELELYVGDALPPAGRAARIGGATVARVTRHIGQRRVAALLLSPHAAAVVGAEVEILAGDAMFPAPVGELLVLEGASFVERGGLSWEVPSPAWLELDPARPALLVGDDVLDTLCPLAARGMNLIVDARRQPDVFERLAGHALGALGAEVTYVLARPGVLDSVAGRRVVGGGMVAWRALVSWAAQARDAGQSVAVVGQLELGAGQSGALTLGQAIELLGARLASTRRGAITTLMRLELPGAGLEEVAETLALGDVDAQLMVRASGRVDARASRSRAEVSQEVLERRAAALAALAEADALAERQRIFGADELSEAEQALVEEARRWR